jgi:cytochrome c oxidase cbb3-type subunit 4
MKAILTAQNWVSDFVVTWWTPVFFVLFIAIVAYSLLPRNKATFDEAARLPLREE